MLIMDIAIEYFVALDSLVIFDLVKKMLNYPKK